MEKAQQSFTKLPDVLDSNDDEAKEDSKTKSSKKDAHKNAKILGKPDKVLGRKGRHDIGPDENVASSVDLSQRMTNQKNILVTKTSLSLFKDMILVVAENSPC